MKRILTLSLLGAVLLLGSCKKYLDTVPDNVLSLDDVFKSRTNIERYIANIYNTLPNEHNQRFEGNENSGVWIGASDEGKFNWDFNYTTVMNRSAWSNTDGQVRTYWVNYYRAIRNATDFIQRIDGATATDIDAQERTRLKGEARALRAFFYYQLMRIYGPVVLMGDELVEVTAGAGELNKARSSFDECTAYVVSEFDKAYDEIGAPLQNASSGRFTQRVVKAYKAQTLFLAASPLFNGNPDYATLKNDDGKQLISQTVDVSKWAKAAAAYKEFFTAYVPGAVDLYRVADANPFRAAYLSTRDVILVSWNKEWIFGRANSGTFMRYDRTPYHDGTSGNQRGAGANGATQAQVDAYFMANGLPITDPASGYQSTGFSNFQSPDDVAPRNTFNQWVNREPRFYVGITYTNRTWLYRDANGQPIITNMEFSGNSGRSRSTSDVSPTGYIIRKNVYQDDATRGSLYLRLGEMYLSYAEALNESNPGDADILRYVNLIRERAGVPQYGAGVNPLPVPAGQAATRDAIRAERRVELAFENVRYFDTRRWRIAEQTDAGQFFGMDMTKNGTAFYTRTLLETRIFRKRDYLFPIPANEVLSVPAIKQNTGW